MLRHLNDMMNTVLSKYRHILVQTLQLPVDTLLIFITASILCSAHGILWSTVDKKAF